jgi:hypothetical protein
VTAGGDFDGEGPAGPVTEIVVTDDAGGRTGERR